MKKIYYCKTCMCKLTQDDKCSGCLMDYGRDIKEEPFFCGNCNSHVGVLTESKGKKLIETYKTLKIDFPNEWATFSWKESNSK